MTTTIVTAKGQVVIPSKLRQCFNIKKGTKLCIVEKEDGIELKPLTQEYFEAYAGILKTKGRLTKSLITERAKEKHRLFRCRVN